MTSIPGSCVLEPQDTLGSHQGLGAPYQLVLLHTRNGDAEQIKAHCSPAGNREQCSMCRLMELLESLQGHRCASVSSGYACVCPRAWLLQSDGLKLSPDGAAALELLISALWLSPLSHPVAAPFSEGQPL